MDFYINGGQIDVTLEGEKTVGDVLRSFEMTCEQNDTAVTGILLDGKKITAEIFDEAARQSLSENTRLEFTVVSKSAVRESFRNLASLFRNLSERMARIPAELQQGRDSDANASIKALADGIDEFCHVTALASLFEDFRSVSIDGKTVSEFFSDFSGILSEFERALKTGDTVLTGDLSEYEISPRLAAINSALEGMT